MVRGVPRLLALRAYYFVSFAALGAYVPFFPRWLSARGLSGLTLGLFVAMMPTMAILAPPCFGLLADALSLRSWLLRLACAGAFLAVLVIALNAHAALGHSAPFMSSWALFLTVTVFAFFRSPMGMMADVIALEQAHGAGTTYARVRLWGSLGFLVAALACGRWLDTRALTPLPIVIAAGLGGAFLLTLALPAPPLPLLSRSHRRAAHGVRRDAMRRLLARPDFRLFLLASLLGQAAHSAYDVGYTLHLGDLGVPGSLMGLAWAIGVVAEILLMAFGQSLLARRRPAELLAFGLVGACVRWLLIATAHATPLLLFLQPLHALSFGLVWLTSVLYVKQHAEPHILATAQSLFVASTALGSVLGILCWLPLYKRSGGAAMFLAASLIAGLAAAVAVSFARSRSAIAEVA